MRTRTQVKRTHCSLPRAHLQTRNWSKKKQESITARWDDAQRPVNNRALPRLAAQSADHRYTVQIELIDTRGTARLGYWTGLRK